MTCGVMINCWDLMKRPCLRDPNHEGYHHPFATEEEIQKREKEKKQQEFTEQMQKYGLTAV